MEEPGKGQGYIDPEEIAGEISQLKRLAPLGVIRKWEAGRGGIIWKPAPDFQLEWWWEVSPHPYLTRADPAPWV